MAKSSTLICSQDKEQNMLTKVAKVIKIASISYVGLGPEYNNFNYVLRKPLWKSNVTICFLFELDPKKPIDCVWYVLEDPLAKLNSAK